MHRKKTALKYLLISFIAIPNVFGQHNYQTDFPAEEFKQRWESVFNEIGDNALATRRTLPNKNTHILFHNGLVVAPVEFVRERRHYPLNRT